MRKPYRVAVVGPGGLGSCCIRELLRIPEMQLVGVLAYSPHKHGVDAGKLVGVGPIGVKATTDFDEFLKLDAEAVVYIARDFGDFRSDEQILALLEAGKNVVTPLPYQYLKARGVEVEARFRTAAIKGNATLHGSGLNPNFLCERLCTLLTGLTNDVTHIKLREFFNCEALGQSDATLQVLGIGTTKEVADQNTAIAAFAENYLREPIIFYADKLGIKLNRIVRTPRHLVTDKPIKTKAMDIEAGTVGLVSFSWTGYSNDKPFYTIEVNWYLGESMRPKDASGDDFWIMEVEGRPSLRVTLASQASFAQNLHMRTDEPAPAGYQLTVIPMVQAIPKLIDAPAGILELDMPQFHWKPDQRN